jgi:hypothetical protein
MKIKKHKKFYKSVWLYTKNVRLQIDACQRSVYDSLKNFTLEHVVLRAFNSCLPYGDPRAKIKYYYGTYIFRKCGTGRGKAFPVFNEAANHEKLWVRDLNFHTFLASR